MSTDNTTNDPAPEPTVTPTPEPAPRRRVWKTSAIAGGVIAALILGAGAGAFAMRGMHGYEKQVLLEPVAVNAMEDDSIVAIKGQVAEIFGNKFIVSDATGRALVETGRDGRDGDLVKLGEAVTAQGRFDDGFIRASMIVHADGKVNELRAGPPRHGPHGAGPRWDRDGRHGGWDRGGPDRGDGPRGGERGPAMNDALPPPAPEPAR